MRFKGYGDPRFYAILHHLAIMHSKKNQDYAKGGKFGHLGNFHRVSEFTKLYPGFDWTTPFGTAIHFMLKQLDAAMILASTNRKSVTGEPVGERLNDVVVYGVIAKILWEEVSGPKKHKKASKRKSNQGVSSLRASGSTRCKAK